MIKRTTQLKGVHYTLPVTMLIAECNPSCSAQVFPFPKGDGLDVWEMRTSLHGCSKREVYDTQLQAMASATLFVRNHENAYQRQGRLCFG